MLNVKNLTDTMSRMELPQLQQYAALHKNDPYIVTLALSIANQKKQMKAGQAGQAGMMPQPKVVDQELAQMVAPPPQQMAAAPQQQGLPENSGIGQLPAQNMQGMAAGGIVAFEEGGDVPGYAGGVFTGEEDMPEWLKVFPPESGFRRTYRAMQQYDKNNPMPVRPAAPAAVPTAPAAAPALPPSATQVMSGLPATKVPPNTGTPPSPPDTKAPVAAKPTAPTDPLAGIKALDTKTLTAADAKKQASELSDSAELRKSLEANETFTTKAYDKLLGDYDKRIAEMPEAYKGYEARLQKEETEAATDKDKALGMAIFQAGLGMMAGTSQYAFENISKGALAGLDNYQSALKDMKKAQRERDKAFADIEAARLAEKRGDLKAHTELQAKGIEALGAAKNRTVDGISKIFQVDTETAKGIFDTKFKENAQNERTMYTAKVDMARQAMSDAAALQRTNIQANAPTGIERILSNPKMLSAYKDYASAGTETKGINAFALEAIKDPSLLPRLEAGSAQDRQLAASIKQHMQSMMISPVNLPGGAANVRP